MKEKAYDTILMDIQMPEMDGLKATAHIRNSQGRQLYIAVMSEDRDICLQSGMNDYLARPMKPEELMNVLKKAAAHIA